VALNLGELVARITADDSRFRRTIDGVHRSLQSVGKVAGFAALAGAATSLAAAMGPAAGAVAGLALSLGAAIAPAAGLAVALPAAAVAWKTSLAIMKLAVDGLSDTLGAAVKGDLKTFREDLKKMPPEMRVVASQLGGAVAGLQRNVQRSFFAPIAREAKGLGRQLRVPLWEGTQVAAAGLGGVAARVLSVAREGRSIAFLSRLFRTIAASANAFGRGVAPLVRGLRDIAAVGLRQLPGVAGWLGQAAAKTGRWLSSISKSGRAAQWFTFAVFTLGQMVGIVRNLGTFFRQAFGSATAGSGNLLVTINTITARLAAWSTSLDGKNSLDGFFIRGRATAQQLWRIVVNLGTVLKNVLGAASTEGGSLLTTIEQLTAKFAAWTQSAGGQKQLGETFALLGQIARDLLTVLPGIAVVIGQLAKWFNDLPPGVQDVVSQFLAWSIVIGLVGGKIGPLVTGLGMVVGGLIKVASAVGPVLLRMGKLVATFAWAALKMAGHFAMMAARAIAWAVVMAAQWLVAFLPVALIIGIVAGLALLIYKNWDTIKKWTVAAWEFVWGWIKKIVGFIVKIFMNFHPVGLIIKHWDTIKKATRTAWDWIWSKLQAIAKKIVDIFMKFHPVGIIIKHWDQIKSGVSNRATSLVGWLRGLPGRILRALGNLGGLLYNAGRNLLVGLWNGIVSMANWLQRSLVNLVRRIVPGPVARILGIASPSKVFAGFGANLAEGMALGMDRNQGLVSDAAAALAGAATGGGSVAATSRPAPVGAAAGRGGPIVAESRLLLDSRGSRLDEVVIEIVRRAVKNQGGGKASYLGVTA
jgi:hypothetical protein